jgi:hypothetical protein
VPEVIEDYNMEPMLNRQNQSTTEKLGKRNGPNLVQAFPKKWWVESDVTAPNLPLTILN